MAEKVRVGSEPEKTGGGDPNVLQLSGANKIRLVDDSETGLLAWKQHNVKYLDSDGEPDEDKTPEFVVCPGPKLCPLCRKPVNAKGKQNFPISKRRATNVWDYGTNSVKVLIGGPQIFNEFKETRDVGIDPLSCDWIIHKTGQNKSTTYKLVRDNPSHFEFEGLVTAETLHNLDKYGDDYSPEKIFEILEKCGWDYDNMKTQEFTEEQALAYVMPFGKHKGMTIEQILAQDPEYAEWFHGQGVSDEKFMDPNFLAFHTAMEARNMVEGIEALMDQASTPPPAAHEQPVQQQPAPTPEPAVSPGMVTLLDHGGKPTEVPEVAVEALLAAGYTRPPEPEPEAPAEPEFPVQLVKDGAEVEAPDATTLAALEAAGFTRIDQKPDDAEPSPDEEPAQTAPTIQEIPAGRAVHVTINGSTIPMGFGAAFTVLKSGQAVDFKDPEAQEYAMMLLSTGGEPPETVEPPSDVQSPEEHALHQEGASPTAQPDPDKPFSCSLCDWAGKTKGSLTQHIKREHPDATGDSQSEASPAPATATAAPPAQAGDGDPLDRVKNLLAQLPKEQKDYKVLISLFKEVSGGKNDINDFTPEELAALEQRIQGMING